MISEILVTPLDLFMAYMLISFALGSDESKQLSIKQELFIGGSAFLLSTAAIISNNNFLDIGIMCLYVCVSVHMKTYSKRIRKIFSVMLLTLIAFLPFNTLIFVMNIAGISYLDARVSAISVVAAVADCFVAFWVYWQRKKYEDKMAIHFTKYEYIFCAFIFLMTLFFGEVLNPKNNYINQNVLANSNGSYLVGFITIAVIFSNVIFIIMIWTSKTSYYYKQINIINQQYIQNELQYFKIYKQAQDDVRRFRHDMKHHIQHLDQLCKEKKFQELQNYLLGFQDEWETTNFSHYQTGDDNVDSILNAKALQFQKENISFSLSGAFSTELRLSAFDLCAIFSNAIDNAIEENQRIPQGMERYIHFSIRRNNHYYIISIENPLSSPIDHIEQTKKADKINHGFGIYNIREKAEKSGGSISIRQAQEKFTLDILLPI